MSQEKIDAYKKEKAERKERLARQKLRMKIIKICTCVLLVAIICAIGISVYVNKTGKNDEAAVTTTDTEAVSTESSSVDTDVTQATESDEKTGETTVVGQDTTTSTEDAQATSSAN